MPRASIRYFGRSPLLYRDLDIVSRDFATIAALQLVATTAERGKGRKGELLPHCSTGRPIVAAATLVSREI